MKKSYAVLFASLLMAFASWGMEAEILQWSEICQPINAFRLILALGSVFWAWMSKSPIKPK